MQPLFSASEMRDADRHAVAEVGIPELVLMEHAALAVVRRLRSHFHAGLGDTRGVLVAGIGNNGGDAMAAARILFHQGVRKILVTIVGEESRLSAAAKIQYRALLKLGVPIRVGLDDESLAACDWIVDGLFGIGISRDVEGEALDAIEKINQVAARRWVVSIDIPSGLSADTGIALGTAVRASETVSLGFLKKGLVTGQAADFVGKLHLRSIQIPRMLPGFRPTALLYGREDARHLPIRRETGHKGDYGHVYVFAGEPAVQGAALLSCLAAYRSGAGLVTLVGTAEDGADARARLPIEVMTSPWSAELRGKMKNAAVALGPGFGTSPERWKVLEEVCGLQFPLVLDADALTLIAQHREEAWNLLARRRAPTIITPHPKEASRLLDCSVEEVQSDRYAAARKLEETWGTFVVLKGRGSVIACPGRPLVVVTAGDPGLSKGGAGDLLTGVLTSLLAQGLEPTRALPLGTYLHGRASELFTREEGHTRSALASDLAGMLSTALAELNPSR